MPGKVAVVLDSNSLETNDRVRKLISAIGRYYSDVQILAASSLGQKHCGATSYGVPYRYVPVPVAKNRLCKYYVGLRVWLAIRTFAGDSSLLLLEGVPAAIPAMLTAKPFIWDLLELPVCFGHGWRKVLFRIIQRRRNCLAVIHTNRWRKSYMEELESVVCPHKHHILGNRADIEWRIASSVSSAEYCRFVEWLDGDDYAYLQGLGSDRRYPYETLTAILREGCLWAVVAGSIAKGVLARLDNEYPLWRDRIYIAGSIPQQYTKKFIESAKMVLVFYTIDHPNNRYCEPNRLWQAVAVGIPTIVGCNETMRGAGSCLLKGDGRNVDEIVEAIRELMSNYALYKQKAMAIKGDYTWEDEAAEIKWELILVQR